VGSGNSDCGALPSVPSFGQKVGASD
jgi:hypothetical protein